MQGKPIKTGWNFFSINLRVTDCGFKQDYVEFYSVSDISDLGDKTNVYKEDGVN